MERIADALAEEEVAFVVAFMRFAGEGFLLLAPSKRDNSMQSLVEAISVYAPFRLAMRSNVGEWHISASMPVTSKSSMSSSGGGGGEVNAAIDLLRGVEHAEVDIERVRV